MGIADTILNFFRFRHEAGRSKWQDFISSYEKQIESAEKRGDKPEEERLRNEYEEQLEAWRAQQGVEALAPKKVLLKQGPTLSTPEVEKLRLLLQQAEGLDMTVVTAEGHWLRGNGFLETGQYEPAIKEYTSALTKLPQFSEAYNNRGVAYNRTEEYDRAIQDCDQAINLRPDYPNAFSNRGVAYDNKGEYERAIQDYDQAISLRPDYTTAFNNRGNAHRHKGEYDSGIQDFYQAISLDPDYPHPYINRACVFSLLRNIEMCVADLAKALELDPNVEIDEQDHKDLEWAKSDPRVRALLGMDGPTEESDC